MSVSGCSLPGIDWFGGWDLKVGNFEGERFLPSQRKREADIDCGIRVLDYRRYLSICLRNFQRPAGKS